MVTRTQRKAHLIAWLLLTPVILAIIAIAMGALP